MRKYLARLSIAGLLMLIIFIQPAIAISQKDAFQQGIQFASAQQGKAVSVLKNYKPKETIKNYNEHPDEASYAQLPDAIKSKAREKIEHDENGKNILSGIDNRKDRFNYSKDSNSKAIKNILNKSSAIYDVVTGQFGDCTKKTNCTTSYTLKTCAESPTTTLQYCSQKLDIEMVPKQHDTHYTLTAYLSVDEHNYAGVTINAVTGKINFLGPHDADFRLDGRLPSNVDCRSLQGRVLSEKGGAKLDYVNFPSCQNGLKFDMHISSGHQKTLTIDMISTKIVNEPRDKWADGCDGRANIASCVKKEERCIESNTTHVVDGTLVTRTCWQKELTYQCGVTGSAQTCQPLREQGCEQVGSVCKNRVNGNCSIYEQSFQCPNKQCTDVGMICNGETYCLDGDCVKQQKQADPDFQRSVSALSAVNEAGKSFSNFNSIFTGERKNCRKVFLGFIDCCADEGWGKNIHLAQCSSEEKDLGKSKENLQAVYLGEYCDKDKLGVCIEHRKAYCVFPSKLARIIQVQGRHGQLGIGFGDPENADCRGLTREQFASLDLGKMDFSDFYTEIAEKQRIEDSGKLSKRLDDKVHDWESVGKANG